MRHHVTIIKSVPMFPTNVDKKNSRTALRNQAQRYSLLAATHDPPYCHIAELFAYRHRDGVDETHIMTHDSYIDRLMYIPMYSL